MVLNIGQYIGLWVLLIWYKEKYGYIVLCRYCIILVMFFLSFFLKTRIWAQIFCQTQFDNNISLSPNWEMKPLFSFGINIGCKRERKEWYCYWTLELLWGWDRGGIFSSSDLLLKMQSLHVVVLLLWLVWYWSCCWYFILLLLLFVSPAAAVDAFPLLLQFSSPPATTVANAAPLFLLLLPPPVPAIAAVLHPLLLLCCSLYYCSGVGMRCSAYSVLLILSSIVPQLFFSFSFFLSFLLWFFFLSVVSCNQQVTRTRKEWKERTKEDRGGGLHISFILECFYCRIFIQ